MIEIEWSTKKRITSDMGLNEYYLGQYPKKLCQKNGIKMNEKIWSTKERLFSTKNAAEFFLTEV